MMYRTSQQYSAPAAPNNLNDRIFNNARLSHFFVYVLQYVCKGLFQYTHKIVHRLWRIIPEQEIHAPYVSLYLDGYFFKIFYRHGRGEQPKKFFQARKHADDRAAGDIHDHRNNFKKLITAADLKKNPQRHLILHELIHGEAVGDAFETAEHREHGVGDAATRSRTPQLLAHAQELRGAEVVHVRPEPDGRIPLERFAEAIDERTALVCCTAISYRTGYRLDVAEVARLAHECGALCLADSYQAAGAVPLDVRALGVDLVTAGTVKYLLASAGLAFMFVRRDLHERLLPTQTGWFADEDIFQMDISDYSPAPDARRFDAGTPPVPNIYAGIAGMGIVQEAGVAAIEAHVRRLVDRLLGGLDELGATVTTPRAEGEYGPLVCVESTDPDALVRALAAERIVTSSRDSSLRVSLHLYNDEDDVDRVLSALRTHKQLLVAS